MQLLIGWGLDRGWTFYDSILPLLTLLACMGALATVMLVCQLATRAAPEEPQVRGCVCASACVASL
jgi:hypothetical protein